MTRPSVRQAFDAYFAKQAKPAGSPIPTHDPQTGQPLSLTQTAAEVLRREAKAGNIRPGGTTRLLYSLPDEDRLKITQVANLYASERDAGRHGQPQKVFDAFDVPKDVGEAMVDGLEMDYVTKSLIERRGSDAGLPLPELTRRDHIAAAIDAHES
jgi:hypothetical protein